MTFLPSVIRAEHRGGYRILVTFNDDTEKTIDFGPWLEGPVFEPLKEPAYFVRFFLDGGAVAWPNGADIAPEMLYEYPETGKRPRKGPTKGTVRKHRRSRKRRRGVKVGVNAENSKPSKQRV